MENTVIVDSDILIDFLRKKQEIVEWINENKNKIRFTTTVINAFELYTGAYKSLNSDKKIKELDDFLETIEIFEFKTNYAKEAGKQRSKLEREGLTIDIRDLLIGVIALTKRIPLKTNNKKHFERIEGLRLVK